MRSYIAVLAALLLGGCATAQLAATGGDRGAGTITVSYETDMFTNAPKDPITAAQPEADRRCRTWGYEGAEAFGGKTSECIAYSGGGYGGGVYGCDRRRHDITFQCYGDLEQ